MLVKVCTVSPPLKNHGYAPGLWRQRSIPNGRAELWHFTLFCKGQQNYFKQINKARAQPLFYSLNLFFGEVVVVVVVMVT